MRSIHVLILLGLLAAATTARAQGPLQIPPPVPPPLQTECRNGACAPVYLPAIGASPRMDWKCPRPNCNPCELPSWGYLNTCWTPWPITPPTLTAANPLTNPPLQPSR